MPPPVNYYMNSNTFLAILKLLLPNPNNSVGTATLVNEALLTGYFLFFVAVTTYL